MTHVEILPTLLKAFIEAWPRTCWQDTNVLLAVSGGPDSVALALMMAAVTDEQTRAHIGIAHFDHRWRAESELEAEFVRDLAGRLSFSFELGVAPADSQRPTEQLAREQRYAFLQDTAKRRGARWIALGHTADDQVETCLHHLLRGTGLRGLAGMPLTRPIHESVTLVRPLLRVRRDLVAAWLHQIGQSYCTDSTNSSLEYTRARIRHQLLPQMREYNAEVDDAILRISGLTRETVDWISQQARDLLQQITIAADEDVVQLKLRTLRQQPAVLLREVLIELWHTRGWPLQAMTQEKWRDLQAFIHGPPGTAEMLPGAISTIHDGESMSVRRNQAN